jgi:hypothetical protein
MNLNRTISQREVDCSATNPFRIDPHLFGHIQIEFGGQRRDDGMFGSAGAFLAR